ncbi:MAG: tryptophan 7-halogenase, partial [Gammaproteobacteria bacterium]
EDPGGYSRAFHVVRSEFDAILLRHAAAEGAEVREGVTIEAVEGQGPVRLHGRDESGRAVTLEAALAIDASGQQAIVGRREALRELNPFFKNLALWSYFDGAARLDGELADNILSAAHPEGWCWYIPLHDGTVSVGAVVDAGRWRERSHGHALQDTYAALLGRCAPVPRLLEGARQVAPVRVIRDYSYSSRSFFSGGTLLCGDAACFIDPVFSTGVHLACLAGLLAADSLEETLSGRRPRAAAFAAYDAAYRRVFERYRRFVTFFYNHHAAPDSYFWQARKLVDPDGALAADEAFVRLVAGTGDFASAREEIARVDARWAESLERERSRSAPGMHLMRVAATLSEMRRRGERPVRRPEAAV